MSGPSARGLTSRWGTPGFHCLYNVVICPLTWSWWDHYRDLPRLETFDYVQENSQIAKTNPYHVRHLSGRGRESQESRARGEGCLQKMVEA